VKAGNERREFPRHSQSLPTCCSMMLLLPGRSWNTSC